MATPVRPPNGPHTFHVVDQNGQTTVVTYQVTDAGLCTGFGTLPWVTTPPGPRFQLDEIAMTTYDDGHCTAVNGGTMYAGTWS